MTTILTSQAIPADRIEDPAWKLIHRKCKVYSHLGITKAQFHRRHDSPNSKITLMTVVISAAIRSIPLSPCLYVHLIMQLTVLERKSTSHLMLSKRPTFQKAIASIHPLFQRNSVNTLVIHRLISVEVLILDFTVYKKPRLLETTVRIQKNYTWWNLSCKASQAA
jgi:hypothetical protein